LRYTSPAHNSIEIDVHRSFVRIIASKAPGRYDFKLSYFTWLTSTTLSSGFRSPHLAWMSLSFPPEILCEIALHLPLTEDVIALSLTNHAVRAALSTPALFKARLLLQKWDIDVWEDEDDKAQRSGDWKRWIRIDYIHSKTLQLFEEAAAGGLSPPPVESESPSPSPDVRNVRSTR